MSSKKPEFTRSLIGQDIIWHSTRIDKDVAVEENDSKIEGDRQFRVYHEGTAYLNEREFNQLFVTAGWDLDGSMQAWLNEADGIPDEQFPVADVEVELVIDDATGEEVPVAVENQTVGL